MGQALPTHLLSSSIDQLAAEKVTNWRGRSGNFYTLSYEALDSFALEGRDVYLLTSGSEILWMGTADELVTDMASRACFRSAIKLASSVLRLLDPPTSDSASMQARWDIEGGQLAGSLALVN